MQASYREAICSALAEEMEDDWRVILLGEDIGLGGVFNVTPGLRDRFGSDRVIDTPISELAFTSAAVGAALTGLRPVVEVMFGDFLPLALDALINQAAKYWYVSNEQASVPLVIRTAVGAGGGLGPLHSQTPVGLLLGQPGLKVAAPATVGDAKYLTKAAIQDDNPVVVFEHKALYGRRAEIADTQAELLDGLGRAAIRRTGSDVTVVAASAAVETALSASEELARDGIETEVIDLRSLRPLDTETISTSVSHTQRLVVIEEGSPLGGYASEVVSVAAETVSPLVARKITMPDLPVPFSSQLESAVLPSVRGAVRGVRLVLGLEGNEGALC